MLEPTPMYASELRPPEQVDMLRHHDMRQAYRDIPASTYPMHMHAPPYLQLPEGKDPLRDFKYFESREHWFDTYGAPKGFEMAGPPDERPPFEEVPDFEREVEVGFQGLD